MVIVVLILMLVGSPAWAQTSPSCTQLPNLACVAGDTYSGAHDFGGATIEVDNGTVASLPSAGTAGRVAVVTDGNSDSDCTTGGGSTVNLCIDTGSVWTIAGDGSAGGTLAGLTDTDVTSPAGGHLLIYDGVDSWDNKAMSSDATISTAGALTIAADAVALTTDTTGNYVASITNGTGITGGDGGSEGAALTLAATLGTDIAPAEMQATDFGDFTCNGSTCSLDDLTSVLTWNEKACLTADCAGLDTPCDCCTGSGTGCAASTFTLAAAPRSGCSTGNDDGGGTILAVSNGITMRCVSTCGGINEFTISSTTWTPCNSANTPTYITYEQ